MVRARSGIEGETKMKYLIVKEKLVEMVKEDKITIGDIDRVYKNLGLIFMIKDGKIKGFSAEVKDKN